MNMMMKLIILLGKGAFWVVSLVGQMIGGIVVGIVALFEKKGKGMEE